ncbi:hypothetical protein [Deinococcus alpinitundrae]|uniref:hypothetical protein n=1 Tax=Deinococcus alpinitundrae TaxID=468913 RepID=UPI001ED976E1|nr:hypothetical protein [Deinococcus alpinitundrae]
MKNSSHNSPVVALASAGASPAPVLSRQSRSIGDPAGSARVESSRVPQQGLWQVVGD